MTPLAIVIPAFKGRWLGAALASIAAQTRRDFTVYVGDDASPDDLRSICHRHAGTLDLRYTRFADNLGARDLVGQWQRYIGLSTEPWVWLFGDDDEMPPDAVARVLQAVQADNGRTALWHFDVDRIDAQGAVQAHERRYPARLSARAFLQARLGMALASYAPEYVFSRAALQAAGGFVPFPRAWCSDDATWTLLAAPGGLRTLPGAPVRWRDSGHNISAGHAADAPAKAQALLQFAAWARRFLAAHPAAADEPGDRVVLAAMPGWLFRQLRNLRVPIDAPMRAAIRHALRGLPGASAPALEWQLLRARMRAANHRRRTAGRS